MQLFSNLKFMAIIFVAALILFLVLLNRKPVAEPQPYTAISQEPAANYLIEAEQRREQEQEKISSLELQNKRQKAKENSVECQFWRQQKNEKSPPKVDEKINEHCNL